MRRVGTAAMVAGVWLAGWAALGAANAWETKPFPTWTDKELKELLEDSPWAGKANLTHAKAGGGNFAIEDKVRATWNSALPMRQAVVREMIGKDGTVTKDQEAFLAAAPQFYVIALKVEGMSAGVAGRGVAPIAKETFLLRDGKTALAVVQAEATMLDKDGKVVPQPQGRPGGPPAAGAPGGAPAGGPPAGPPGGGRGGGFGGFGGFGGGGSAMIVFAFPATPPITLEDKEVEIVSRIGQYNVKKKFKLKDMVVNGKLAI